MRERNKGGNKIEEATFGNNAFGVGDRRFCSSDGAGIYQRWHPFTSTHHI
jgi:hypothetical protein